MSAQRDYLHKQEATHTRLTIAGALLLMALVGIAMALTGDEHPLHYAVLALAFVTVLAAGYLFSSMTIKRERGQLNWHFGPGYWTKRLPLDEIESAEPVRNPWYYGWGIHYTPQGWLYNVSGFEAVEIRLKSGKRLRLGTDEPERLAEAIRPASG